MRNGRLLAQLFKNWAVPQPCDSDEFTRQKKVHAHLSCRAYAAVPGHPVTLRVGAANADLRLFGLNICFFYAAGAV